MVEFILTSPWRVIGACAILWFTGYNLKQVGHLRIVEVKHEHFHTHFDKKGDKPNA
ncbi:hypothetical protein D3C79_806710 [compost metagenome]